MYTPLTIFFLISGGGGKRMISPLIPQQMYTPSVILFQISKQGEGDITPNITGSERMILLLISQWGFTHPMILFLISRNDRMILLTIS